MDETVPILPVTPAGRSDAMRGLRSLAIGFAGWLIPGLGQALLKMWGRAAACFAAVVALAFIGLAMRGNLFVPGAEDAFGFLGYAADLGMGALYFFARGSWPVVADIAHASGDYGTRFLATAGILNYLVALHAYEAARGRKA